MTVRLHFVLVSEGSSDDGLIPHLENLCIEQGATEVTGTAPDFARLAGRVGHTVSAKLAAAIKLEPSANLVFLHRDSDARDATPRYEEINAAAAENDLKSEYVAVVPVQETETWLLSDERAVRKAAYRPNGTRPLNLPKPQQLEQIANPKEVLRAALVAASELTGRRLERFKRDFPAQRRLLMLQLPVGGSLESLQSWRRLRADVSAAIARLESGKRILSDEGPA